MYVVGPTNKLSSSIASISGYVFFMGQRVKKKHTFYSIHCGNGLDTETRPKHYFLPVSTV